MRRCFASELAKKMANSHRKATPHCLTRSGIEPATSRQEQQQATTNDSPNNTESLKYINALSVLCFGACNGQTGLTLSQTEDKFSVFAQPDSNNKIQ